MGEVQKAYNAYAGIVQREADDANEAAQRLRNGPLAIPKDLEWRHFIKDNKHFVDPRLPVRKVNSVSYPGKYEAGASEVRAGMLERKSKYLKSYSPGWSVDYLIFLRYTINNIFQVCPINNTSPRI